MRSLVLLWAILTVVSGSVVLYVRLHQFTNQYGLVSKGLCCDGNLISSTRFCSEPCDYGFIVCIDSDLENKNIALSDCPIGRIVTGIIEDQNTVTFDASIGDTNGTPNPMTFPLLSWPVSRSVNIKVNVYDDDTGGTTTTIGTMQYIYSASPAAGPADVASRLINLALEESDLDLELQVYCGTDYYGAPNCDIYCASNSLNYVCNTQTGAMDCNPGWVGDDCSVSVNDCAIDSCQNDGQCIDGHLGFTCSCAIGYNGSICDININECADSPCINGGTCVDGVAIYSCSCVLGYSGNECQINVDDCVGTPCSNSGTCVDGVNSYLCTCLAGYTGTNCETDINDCANDPCSNGGSCSDAINSFTCACPVGWSGSTCGDNIDECMTDPCFNNATCTDGVATFTCTCALGWTGLLCDVNINDCSSDPCFNDGTCFDGVGNFTCACLPAWSGPTCSVNTDNCTSNPCFNGGSCGDGPSGFSCSCASGWTGSTCLDSIDYCASQPCGNNGNCSNDIASYSCACEAGWSGSTCSENINECTSSPCANGATCVGTAPGFTCTCSAGYTGSSCTQDISDTTRVSTTEDVTATSYNTHSTQNTNQNTTRVSTTGGSIDHSGTETGWTSSGNNATVDILTDLTTNTPQTITGQSVTNIAITDESTGDNIPSDYTDISTDLHTTTSNDFISRLTSQVVLNHTSSTATSVYENNTTTPYIPSMTSINSTTTIADNSNISTTVEIIGQSVTVAGSSNGASTGTTSTRTETTAVRSSNGASTGTTATRTETTAVRPRTATPSTETTSKQGALEPFVFFLNGKIEETDIEAFTKDIVDMFDKDGQSNITVTISYFQGDKGTIVTQVTVTSGNENLSLETLWNETSENIKDQALPYEIYVGKVSPIQQADDAFPSVAVGLGVGIPLALAAVGAALAFGIYKKVKASPKVMPTESP